MNMNYDDDGLRIEEFLGRMYQNPLDNSDTHIVCPNCGESLYDGNIHYPSIGLCEYCLPDYKERVDLD